MDFKRDESVAIMRRVELHLVDATDGITPATGEVGGQPQIATNGSGFVNTANTLVSIGFGAYYVELTQAELATLGKFMIRYKSAATAEFQDVHQVKIDPYGAETGSGTLLFTWTEQTSGAVPVGDVYVEFSTDNNKVNVVAAGFTDNFGQLKVLLDPGTYFVWRSKAGYTPTTPNPIQQVVSP